jgi:hypothetical protein
MRRGLPRPSLEATEAAPLGGAVFVSGGETCGLAPEAKELRGPETRSRARFVLRARCAPAEAASRRLREREASG